MFFGMAIGSWKSRNISEERIPRTAELVEVGNVGCARATGFSPPRDKVHHPDGGARVACGQQQQEEHGDQDNKRPVQENADARHRSDAQGPCHGIKMNRIRLPF